MLQAPSTRRTAPTTEVSEGRASWGDVQTRADFLATVRLFARFPRWRLEEMAARLRAREVSRGAFVFLAGEASRELNILWTGQIKVIHETEEGQGVILRLIRPGEIFGGAAGWGSPRYPASAVAQQPSIVLQLPARDFTDLISSQPYFALAVIRELGARLREAETRITELQTARVEPRLARTLLRLARRTGLKTPAGIDLDVRLTRQEIAELTGTTLSTISRTLSAWERQGIIHAGREHIVIRCLPALRALARGLTASDGETRPPPEDR
ncbi:MAG TPA: Crp/Fnr family transcriptional regulator [Chloroflexota bacterium]|nr:Crp/Fnr family transcriptional regulator [Chloroflexota bacterium]